MNAAPPEEQLAGFLARYTPEIAAAASDALARLRARLPGAVEMVYDSYNALAIAFGASERASEAVVSLTVYPRWVSLFFLAGARLPDPERLLKGGGKTIRQLVLRGPDDVDLPAVAALIAHAAEASPTPFDPSAPRRMVIRSISAKQRPRRPAET